MSVSIGLSITAVVAIVYGLAVAFGPRFHDNRRFWQRFTLAGSLVVLLVGIVTVVIPWLGERLAA